MHFQSRDADEKARAAELFSLVVLAKNVADVLAEEALDALAKFLHAVDIAADEISSRRRAWA